MIGVFKNFTSTYGRLPKEVYYLFICMIINGLGNFVFPLISLIFVAKIGFTKEQVGMIITVYIICQMPCLIIGGKLIDYYGRKRMLMLYYSLGAAGYLICSMINPNIIMAVLIIITAILFSMSTPIINTLIADFTTKENRKASYSLIYLANNVGFSIAPILAGALFDNYLSILFIINGISATISVAIFSIFIEEPNIIYQNKVKKIVANKDCIKQEKTIYILNKHPILIVNALVMFIYQFSYSQWGFLLPLQMIDQFNTNGAKLYGIIAAANGFVVIVFTPLLTKSLITINPKKLISYGGLCYGVAFTLFSFANSFIVFLISIIIMTLGEILVVMNNNVLIADNSPESHRGRILSILSIITGIGYALGPLVVGKFSYLDYTVIWLIIAISVFASAIGMQVFTRNKLT